MTATEYARAIRQADFKGERDKMLDLWEDVAVNASSTNRLYEMVTSEIERLEREED